MPQLSLKAVLLSTSAAVALIFFNLKVLDNRLSDGFISLVQKPAAAAFKGLEKFRMYVVSFKKWRLLAQENEYLRSENLKLIQHEARLKEFQRENEFLRKTLELPTVPGQTLITSGNIFLSSFGPEGTYILLNRGFRDGVQKGDFVVAQDQVLVGKVTDTFERYSRIMTVSDPEFEVAVRVYNGTTQAIARGSGTDSMNLDLLVQNEPIKEGDVLTTVGNDGAPPALVVGRVSYVDKNESRIFQKARVTPTMNETSIAYVIILRR